MNRTHVFALASALALLTTPAFARDGVAHDTAVVSYADLDTTREPGAEALYRRINAAAANVCGRSFGRVSVRERTEVRACMRDAVEQAVAQLDQPVLTAYHRAQGSRTARFVVAAR